MKTWVDVLCIHYKNGHVKPLQILWNDNRRYTIDRITQVMPAASLKSGGIGLRYTCEIHSQIRHLYLEEGKWFVE
ncbi:MAG: hypothetical protein PUF50_02055 [Erysipelotrichaceae bacterium]|nr:hypothetical protein [Erysipelotrichaceae bacterium]